MEVKLLFAGLQFYSRKASIRQLSGTGYQSETDFQQNTRSTSCVVRLTFLNLGYSGHQVSKNNFY